MRQRVRGRQRVTRRALANVEIPVIVWPANFAWLSWMSIASVVMVGPTMPLDAVGGSSRGWSSSVMVTVELL